VYTVFATLIHHAQNEIFLITIFHWFEDGNILIITSPQSHPHGSEGSWSLYCHLCRSPYKFEAASHVTCEALSISIAASPRMYMLIMEMMISDATSRRHKWHDNIYRSRIVLKTLNKLALVLQTAQLALVLHLLCTRLKNPEKSRSHHALVCIRLALCPQKRFESRFKLRGPFGGFLGGWQPKPNQLYVGRQCWR